MPTLASRLLRALTLTIAPPSGIDYHTLISEETTAKGTKYRLRIRGLKGPDGTIPLVALQEVLRALVGSSERALRLVVEGTSVKSGSVPKWLKASLEYSITGISRGSTVLEIEAPALGETAPSLIRQQDLWLAPPRPDDTAFTVLSKSVSDASARRMDSERFDSGVLDALLDFRPLFQRYATEVTLSSRGRPKEHFSISEQSLENIGQLRIRTPEPQAVTIAGEFDMIEHSRGKFKLILEDGPILQGMVDQAHLSVEQMRDYWGKKVTVRAWRSIDHRVPSAYSKPR
jgi:hypothetical protein